jgi:hypothetical protein
MPVSGIARIALRAKWMQEWRDDNRLRGAKKPRVVRASFREWLRKVWWPKKAAKAVRP